MPQIDRTCERGAAGVEYGILIAGVAALIVAIALLLGPEVIKGFQAVYAEIS